MTLLDDQSKAMPRKAAPPHKQSGRHLPRTIPEVGNRLRERGCRYSDAQLRGAVTRGEVEVIVLNGIRRVTQAAEDRLVALLTAGKK